MTGVVESSPGTGVPSSSDGMVGGTTPVETTPGSGGLEDASPQSDSPFSLSDEVMNSDFEEIEVPATSVAAKTAPEAPAKEGDPPKPTDPKPATPAAATPSAAPEKPAEVKLAEVAKPTTTAPVAVNLLDELAKNRDQLISHLAETRFKPTKEESDLLDVDATAGIAKIAARVYYEAATSTMQQLNRFISEQLPALIDQHSQSTNNIRDAENDFYKEWPNLNREADDKVVAQYANIFRQANPSATRKEAIEKVGQIVSVVLNKPKSALVASPKPNGAPRPFAPSSGAARVVSQVPVSDLPPFAGLGMEFE